MIKNLTKKNFFFISTIKTVIFFYSYYFKPLNYQNYFFTTFCHSYQDHMYRKIFLFIFISSDTAEVDNVFLQIFLLYFSFSLMTRRKKNKKNITVVKKKLIISVYNIKLYYFFE